MRFTSEITVRVVQIMGDDSTIARAAMVSTGAKPEPAKVKGLIGTLIQKKHGTPFEHAAITFEVHAPIFVWREWHRHRIGMSYNEESARYKQLEPVFWIPKRSRHMMPVADPGDECNKMIQATGGEFQCWGKLEKVSSGIKQCQKCTKVHKYHHSMSPCFGPASDAEYDWFCEDQAFACNIAYMRYEKRIKRGYAKEVARSCLPVCIYSSCWVTCNPRSLMHFLSLRTHEPTAKFPSYPQAEIEEAARACEQVFKEGWPVTYEAFNNNGRVAP